MRASAKEDKQHGTACCGSITLAQPVTMCLEQATRPTSINPACSRAVPPKAAGFAPKAGVLAPKAGVDAGVPNALPPPPKGVAPKAAPEAAPNAGVDAAPKAGVEAPNAGCNTRLFPLVLAICHFQGKLCAWLFQVSRYNLKRMMSGC